MGAQPPPPASALGAVGVGRTTHDLEQVRPAVEGGSLRSLFATIDALRDRGLWSELSEHVLVAPYGVCTCSRCR